MTTGKELAQRENPGKVQHLAELPTVTPAVDIYENGDEILVVADCPGVSPEDVDVRVEAGQLDIEARQNKPKEQANSLPPVIFSRAFRVPDSVDPQGISAELKAGVLSIHLRKSEAAKPKRIKVSVG